MNEENDIVKFYQDFNRENKDHSSPEGDFYSIIYNIEYKLRTIMSEEYTLASNRAISDDEFMVRKANAKSKVQQSFDETGELSFNELFHDKHELDKIKIRTAYLAEVGLLNKAFSETILKATEIESAEIGELLTVFKDINNGIEPLYQEAMKEIRKNARS